MRIQELKNWLNYFEKGTWLMDQINSKQDLINYFGKGCKKGKSTKHWGRT